MAPLRFSNRGNRKVMDDVNDPAIVDNWLRWIDRECYFDEQPGIQRSRKIDLVLVYSETQGEHAAKMANVIQKWMRQRFVKEITDMGLEVQCDHDSNLMCTKIHAPESFLLSNANFHKIKAPLQKIRRESEEVSLLEKLCNKVFRNSRLNPFFPIPGYVENEVRWLAYSYNENHKNIFKSKVTNTSFGPLVDPMQRTNLVWDSLLRIMIPKIDASEVEYFREALKNTVPSIHSDDDMDDVNDDANHVETVEDEIPLEFEEEDSRAKYDLKYMLSHGIYNDAFPLHDSYAAPTKTDSRYKGAPPEKLPFRRFLRKHWANYGCWFRPQPIMALNNYLGSYTAMYFAWLDNYTLWLIPLTMMGIMCYVYMAISHVAWNTGIENSSQTFCEQDLYLCRLCNALHCLFRPISDTCVENDFLNVADHWSSMVFSVSLSIWSVLYLELWKQKESELVSAWNVKISEHSEQKIVRSEVRCGVKPDEPESKWSIHKAKLKAAVVFSACLFFVSLMLAFLFSVVVMRIYMKKTIYKWMDADQGKIISSGMVTLFFSGLITAFLIGIFQFIWEKVAWRLTEMEGVKTDEDFEKSYIHKNCFIQFFNWYGGCLYLALIEGKENPSPDLANTLSIECAASGCISELYIYILIILLGKQVFNNLSEILLPPMKKHLRTCWLHLRYNVKKQPNDTDEANTDDVVNTHQSRWRKDFSLSKTSTILQTYDDYFEIIIQFGFLTMFSVAFPLIPAFCLLNNIFEIRIDARKLLINHRRSVPRQAADIGPWMDVLSAFVQIAVLVNATVVAFTTHVIDKFVWEVYYQPLNVSWSEMLYNEFNTSWYDAINPELRYINDTELVSKCLYKARFAFAPIQIHDEQISHTIDRYHVLGVRLWFIIVYILVVRISQGVIASLINSVPQHVKDKSRLERKTYNEAVLREESKNLTDKQKKRLRRGATVVDSGNTDRLDRLEDWAEADYNDEEHCIEHTKTLESFLKQKQEFEEDHEVEGFFKDGLERFKKTF